MLLIKNDVFLSVMIVVMAGGRHHIAWRTVFPLIEMAIRITVRIRPMFHCSVHQIDDNNEQSYPQNSASVSQALLWQCSSVTGAIVTLPHCRRHYCDSAPVSQALLWQCSSVTGIIVTVFQCHRQWCDSASVSQMLLRQPVGVSYTTISVCQMYQWVNHLYHINTLFMIGIITVQDSSLFDLILGDFCRSITNWAAGSSGSGYIMMYFTESFVLQATICHLLGLHKESQLFDI